MKIYLLEYRDVKKNVETFGLKHWYEGISLVIELPDKVELTKENLEDSKVHQNLGKVQSRKNSIQIPNKRGIIQTRPQNMFENIFDMILSSQNMFKHYKHSNNVKDNIKFIVYNKNKGIFNFENHDNSDNTNTDNNNNLLEFI